MNVYRRDGIKGDEWSRRSEALARAMTREPRRRSDQREVMVSRSRAWRVLISALLVLAGILMLLPVLWVVVESVEPASEQFLLPPVWFPTHVTLASYNILFSAAPFLLNLINSVIVTVSVVVGAAIVSVLAAYAFARLQFRGREGYFSSCSWRVLLYLHRW